MSRPDSPGFAFYQTRLPVLASLAAALILLATHSWPLLTMIAMLVLSGAAMLALLGRGPTWPVVSVPLALLAIVITVPMNQLPDNTIWKVGGVCILVMGTGLLLRRGMPLPAGAVILLLLLLEVNFMTLFLLGPEGLPWVVLLGVTPFIAFVAGGQLTPHCTRIVQAAIIAFAFAQSLLAICEPVLGLPKLWAPARVDETGAPRPMTNELLGMGLERAQGTLGHPLPLGLLILLGIILATRIQRNSVRWISIAVMLGGLAAAGTRLSMVLALICVIALGPRRETRVISAAYKLGLAVMGFLFITRDVDFLELFTRFQTTGSLTHRLEALRSVERLLLWQDMPQVVFGHGFGSAQQAFETGLLQSDGLQTVDNQFVFTLYVGGVIGVTLLVAFLIRVLIRASTTRSRLVPAVLAVMITMWAYDVFLWPSSVTLCMLVLGMAVSDRRDGPADGSAETRLAESRSPARHM